MIGIKPPLDKEGLYTVFISGPPLSVEVTEQYLNLASTVKVGHMAFGR